MKNYLWIFIALAVLLSFNRTEFVIKNANLELTLNSQGNISKAIINNSEPASLGGFSSMKDCKMKNFINTYKDYNCSDIGIFHV